jgi:hypothetical protein
MQRNALSDEKPALPNPAVFKCAMKDKRDWQDAANPFSIKETIPATMRWRL